MRATASNHQLNLRCRLCGKLLARMRSAEATVASGELQLVCRRCKATSAFTLNGEPIAPRRTRPRCAAASRARNESPASDVDCQEGQEKDLEGSCS